MTATAGWHLASTTTSNLSEDEELITDNNGLLWDSAT